MERSFVLRNCEETQPSRDLAEDIVAYAKRMAFFTEKYRLDVNIAYDGSADGGRLEISCVPRADGSEIAASAALVSIMSAAMLLGARRGAEDNWREVMKDAWSVMTDNVEESGQIMADMAGMQIALADRLRVREAREKAFEPMVDHSAGQPRAVKAG